MTGPAAGPRPRRQPAPLSPAGSRTRRPLPPSRTGVEALLAPGPLAPRAKAALAAEIVGDYLRTRWLLRRRALPAALAALRAGGAPPEVFGARAQATGLRLGRAVARTLSPLPADSRCLVRSLVLVSLLARRGIDSTLVIGVRAGDGLRAHAWVEHEGRALLPTGRSGDGGEYERLVEV